MRIGTVSQVNENGTIKVERLGVVSPIVYMVGINGIVTSNIPKVGEQVVYDVIDGIGVCFGVICKERQATASLSLGSGEIYVNHETMTIKALNILLDGDVRMTGDVL